MSTTLTKPETASRNAAEIKANYKAFASNLRELLKHEHDAMEKLLNRETWPETAGEMLELFINALNGVDYTQHILRSCIEHFRNRADKTIILPWER